MRPFLLSALLLSALILAAGAFTQQDNRMSPQIGRIFIPDSATKEHVPMSWLRCYNGKEMGWCMPPVGADWQEDLKRSEVQKALGDYIQTHCEVKMQFHPAQSGTGTTDATAGTWTQPQSLRCWQDAAGGQE